LQPLRAQLRHPPPHQAGVVRLAKDFVFVHLPEQLSGVSYQPSATESGGNPLTASE